MKSSGINTSNMIKTLFTLKGRIGLRRLMLVAGWWIITGFTLLGQFVTIQTDYCVNYPQIRLTASCSSLGGTYTYLWTTPDGQRTGNPIDVQIIGQYSVTLVGTGACNGFSQSITIGQDLVTNGNFSLGNTGFTTAYTYNPNLVP